MLIKKFIFVFSLFLTLGDSSLTAEAYSPSKTTTPQNKLAEAAKKFSTSGEIEIEGEIIRYPSAKTVYVRMNGYDVPIPIRSAYRETQADLEHLESGDYVYGRGEIVSKSYVLLDSIDLIGIRKILGRWNERQEQVIFHFQSFNALRLEKYVNGTKVSEDLRYRLAPDSKDSWTIFLAESAGVHLGRMDYVEQKIRIRLIDVKTGEVVQTLTLDALKFK